MHIDLFNSYFGQSSPHPLIGVGDLARADASIFTPTDFGMYCVVLMDVNFGQLTKDGNESHISLEHFFHYDPDRKSHSRVTMASNHEA